MRLVLVRHGETEHNRGGLTLGRADVALNERGHLQARALAASFVQVPEAIYCSPLSRTRETAAAIALATGRDVIVDPDLIEMDVGEMEHLDRDELRARYPEFLRAWLSDDAGDARMPGGETLAEVQDRSWATIERMRKGHVDAAREIVAVTHNFVILTAVCRALGLPLSSFRRIRHDVAARTVIEIGDSGAVVVALNDRSHLR
jgi:probable phosphoglycerate mutase